MLQEIEELDLKPVPTIKARPYVSIGFNKKERDRIEEALFKYKQAAADVGDDTMGIDTVSLICYAITQARIANYGDWQDLDCHTGLYDVTQKHK